KTGFEVATGMLYAVTQNAEPLELNTESVEREKYAGAKFQVAVKEGEATMIYKFAANLSSQNHDAAEMEAELKATLKAISEKGFEAMLAEQAAAWAEKWKHNDIIIEGDASAQQGIRFNIFQLNQTYT